MIDNNAEMSARLKALEEKKKALELELARLKEERDLAIRNSPVDLTQKDYFMSYTKKELLEIAKEMNLKIASSWKKSEVAEKITNNVLMSSWLTKKCRYLARRNLNCSANSVMRAVGTILQ